MESVYGRAWCLSILSLVQYEMSLKDGLRF